MLQLRAFVTHNCLFCFMVILIALSKSFLIKSMTCAVYDAVRRQRDKSY